MTTDLPPDSDEFELSLFGPGVGECIVIHMGGGQWLVVDSCIDPQKKQPIALSYFARLGIDAAGAVSLFVVTHWHDDHMAGAAEVLDKAVSAGFVCSVALKADEFSTVVGQAQDLMTRDSDVAEMARVFDILIERRASHTSATSAGPYKMGRSRYATLPTVWNFITQCRSLVTQSLLRFNNQGTQRVQ